MKNIKVTLLFLLTMGCIGTDIVDDAVPAKVVIQNPIDTLKVGESYQFKARYTDESGEIVNVPISWESANDDIISITADGLATAEMQGSTMVTASHDTAGDTLYLVAGERTTASVSLRTADLMTSSTYPLKGSAELEEKDDGALELRFGTDFKTTSALPGLYVYLSNNLNSTANAYEIGAVDQFEGAQTYPIDAAVGINDFDYVLFYCKPFNVPVGEGLLVP
ncbi:MAG TPA: hypothetical protein DDY13_03895 [Cytophagales bacterium]|jgi:hypothetical protein|nr:hypothetical protein [Cytophagales bacterium]